MGLTIYKASAGSGKTYTLAREYIRLALSGDYAYQNILAITFTVKATEEMKHRILSFLRDLSQGKEEDLRDQLIKATQNSARPYDAAYIKKQAKVVYANMLHNYGRFEVSTLDSFFVRTVKSIAKELSLPINFDIELDHDKTMEAMVVKLFEEAKDNAALRKWLNKYAEHKMAENKSWQIKRDILEDGKQVFSEKYHQANQDSVGHEARDGERGLNDIINDTQKSKALLEKEVVKLCEQALKIIQDAGLEHANFSRSQTKDFEKGKDIFNKDFRLNGFLVKFINGENNWYTGKADPTIKRIIDGIDATLSSIGKKLIESGKLLSTYTSFQSKIFIYGILDYLNTLLVDYRDEKNLLLLTDLSALLSRLIGNNDAPFIFEKAGSKYKHIFVDEFQDTSDLQWKNILPLVLNALGNNDEVLIVGDVKQSIYRWRGGNLNLLLQNIEQDLFPHSKDAAIALGTNYRSDKAIVEFNNAVFSHLRDNIADYAGSTNEGLFSKAYGEINQKLKANGIGEGFVSVNFVNKDLDYDEELSSWIDGAIKESLTDGFTYRDMLVLVETKANGQRIADIIRALGIKVITDRSLLLRNSEKVLFLISCAKWLSNTKNQVAQAQLLYLYKVIFKKELQEVHPLFDVRREGWIDNFITAMPDGFPDQIESWKSKPVYEAIEDIIYFFGINTIADAFVQKFQDEVLALMESGETSFEDLLKWWSANRDTLSISAPASENGIQIMTVHKSKGLESPVVFFPFSAKEYSAKGIFWTDQIPERFQEFNLLPLNFSGKLKENEFKAAYELELSEAILERLNVHYVAFTRPRNRLYVCGSYKANAKTPDLGKIKKLEVALLETLRSLGYPSSEDDERLCFTFGKKEKRKADKKDPNHIETEELCDYPSFPYSNKLNLKQGSKRFFELNEKGLESERKRGLIIHSLLERLDEPSILAKEIEKLQNEGVINIDEVNFVRETFASLMKDAVFSSFFDPKWQAFVEREILLEGKSYRPDRVITNGKAAKVIDYKSEKKDVKHEKQVKRYADLLYQMGYTHIEMYLVYTISQQVIQVQ